MNMSENNIDVSNQYDNEENNTIIDWFNRCIKNYLTVEGRAGRKEFWYFLLIFLTVLVISTVVLFYVVYNIGSSSHPVLSILVWVIYLFIFCWLLFTFIPLISVSIRRLHDINLSGWWLLLYFTGIGSLALIIMFCIDSKPTENRWGKPAHNINQ